MPHNPQVLVVDESAECREVLRTALERAGTRTLEAATAAEGLEAFESLMPDLVVLDLAAEPPESDFSAALREAAGLRATPIVILGTARVPAAGGHGVHYVEKPYHFAPLVRRIEDLLSARMGSDG